MGQPISSGEGNLASGLQSVERPEVGPNTGASVGTPTFFCKLLRVARKEAWKRLGRYQPHPYSMQDSCSQSGLSARPDLHKAHAKAWGNPVESLSARVMSCGKENKVF